MDFAGQHANHHDHHFFAQPFGLWPDGDLHGYHQRGAGANPTGTVDFNDGATDLTPGGVSIAGGQAIFTTTALAAGSHTITAVYSGDGTYTGSQGSDSANPQVVAKDSTSTTVLVSPSTLVSGQSVAFVAFVSNTSGPLRSYRYGAICRRWDQPGISGHVD